MVAGLKNSPLGLGFRGLGFRVESARHKEVYTCLDCSKRLGTARVGKHP